MTTTSGAASVDTRPFAPFEWLLARRYLRARRKEGFISVIAGFSFIGIMLGVATLIIVMAVMNGFRSELVQKILGVNGHVIVYRVAEPFTQALMARLTDPRIGSGLDHEADYGSLATASQLDRVRAHLEDRGGQGGLERARRVEGDEPAAVHESEAVAVLRLLHVVGRHEHRGPGFGELRDPVPERAPGVGIHAGRRLVDEQDRIRQHMKVWINEDPVRDIAMSVAPTDEVTIMQALSGG